MKVTRNVITDLLPLYLANEASDDTRALNQAYLKQGPELARTISQTQVTLLSSEPPAALNKEHELKTLERTRTMLKLRSILMGVRFSSRWHRSPVTRSAGTAGR